MEKIPERIHIANLPTKIEKLDRLSQKLGGPNLYIKRDDQTGTEISGNKIRKLEFSLKEAIDRDCDTLITCGGVQSNHCRATAAIAAKLGLKSVLVLRGTGEEAIDGNLFLDKLFGADIHFITPEEYRNDRTKIMLRTKEQLEAQGMKPYVIPEGASNGIGSFGYFAAMDEIRIQEKEMGIFFDGIVIAVGSGGTYAGLALANKVLERAGRIYGVNVCDDADYFKIRILEVLEESKRYMNSDMVFSKEDIHIIDGYVGRGYAISRPEELDFIYELARLEGVILDPTYTGKAMYGLVEEIKKGKFKECKNLLFIHTGGVFGLFPQKDLFTF